MAQFTWVHTQPRTTSGDWTVLYEHLLKRTARSKTFVGVLIRGIGQDQKGYKEKEVRSWGNSGGEC